jgi:hypothetical protein
MYYFFLSFLFLTAITFCSNPEWQLIHPTQVDANSHGNIWQHNSGALVVAGGNPGDAQHTLIHLNLPVVNESMLSFKLISYDKGPQFTVGLFRRVQDNEPFVGYSTNEQQKAVWISGLVQPTKISTASDHSSIVWNNQNENSSVVAVISLIQNQNGVDLQSKEKILPKGFIPQMILKHVQSARFFGCGFDDNGNTIVHKLTEYDNNFVIEQTLRVRIPCSYFAINNSFKNNDEACAVVSYPAEKILVLKHNLGDPDVETLDYKKEDQGSYPLFAQATGNLIKCWPLDQCGIQNPAQKWPPTGVALEPGVPIIVQPVAQQPGMMQNVQAPSQPVNTAVNNNQVPVDQKNLGKKILTFKNALKFSLLVGAIMCAPQILEFAQGVVILTAMGATAAIAVPLIMIGATFVIPLTICGVVVMGLVISGIGILVPFIPFILLALLFLK